MYQSLRYSDSTAFSLYVVLLETAAESLLYLSSCDCNNYKESLPAFNLGTEIWITAVPLFFQYTLLLSKLQQNCCFNYSNLTVGKAVNQHLHLSDAIKSGLQRIRCSSAAFPLQIFAVHCKCT